MTHAQAVAMAYRNKPAKRAIPVAFSNEYLYSLFNEKKEQRDDVSK